ncbi:MAG: hypothetical protein IBJ11_03525 [Phycisphaerales bacterium]|nr:hypothetical protein [Phycisphaerales bacterium]
MPRTDAPLQPRTPRHDAFSEAPNAAGDDRSLLTPLPVVLSLTAVNNLGAGTALMLVYFLTRQSFGFTAEQNLFLALLQGVTYIAGALTAGPVIRRLAGPGKPLSMRGLLAVLMAALAGLCALPWAVRQPWTMWVLVGMSSALTGWLWPVIESYLASGRTDAELRRAAGGFNLSWAGTQVLVLWMTAPFKEHHPLEVIAVMGVSHLAGLALLLRMPRDPADHHEHVPHMPVDEVSRYRRLLHCSRMLLVLSYAVFASINPLLDGIAKRLLGAGHDAAGWTLHLITIVASTWLFSRVAMFSVMQRYHWWQGRRTTLVWSSCLLVGGFALSMLAAHVAVLVVGLALFGLGMGSVYAAAFYYAMEVGSAGVDAGGKHEALIGLGYMAGPISGLLAGVAVSRGWLRPDQLSLGTFVGVALLLAVGLAAIARAARRPIA